MNGGVPVGKVPNGSWMRVSPNHAVPLLTRPHFRGEAVPYGTHEGLPLFVLCCHRGLGHLPNCQLNINSRLACLKHCTLSKIVRCTCPEGVTCVACTAASFVRSPNLEMKCSVSPMHLSILPRAYNGIGERQFLKSRQANTLANTLANKLAVSGSKLVVF